MATFWERATHSVYRMFSMYFDIVILVISHFGFKGGTLVLIALIPSHCCSFTLSHDTSCLYYTCNPFPGVKRN